MEDSKNTIVFNEDACRDAKKLLGKNVRIMKTWNDYFAPAKSIGKCSTLITRHQPTTYEDFFNSYIRYARSHIDQPIKDRGLTTDELFKLAENYKRISETNATFSYDVETYLNDALCHIIVETFDGRKKELDIIRRLKELGFEVEVADDEFDRKYGIDIICKKDGKVVMGIQVKPHTFLTSSRKDVGEDRVRLYEKYKKAKDELNIETYYAVYDSSAKDEVHWLINKDGKISFKYDVLFENVGSNVVARQPIFEKINSGTMWT